MGRADNLQRFVKLRDSLVTQTNEKSENGIQSIVQQLAWNDSIYRTFNEGLRLSFRTGQERSIPKSLVEYIHVAHVSYISISLRKLYESRKTGNRKINSIRTMVQDIHDARCSITRENFLVHDGYSYEVKEDSTWKDELVINGRHNIFDTLCFDKGHETRDPCDTISEQITISLCEKAQLNKDIEIFCNKFLAHASARNNRPDEKSAFDDMTLRKVQEQYRNAIWALQIIARIADIPVLTTVPVPQFDVLQDWEMGLFNETNQSQT